MSSSGPKGGTPFTPLGEPFNPFGSSRHTPRRGSKTVPKSHKMRCVCRCACWLPGGWGGAEAHISLKQSRQGRARHRLEWCAPKGGIRVSHQRKCRPDPSGPCLHDTAMPALTGHGWSVLGANFLGSPGPPLIPFWPHFQAVVPPIAFIGSTVPRRGA